MKNRKTAGALLLGTLLVLASCIKPTRGEDIQPTAGLTIIKKDVVLKKAALVQPETRQETDFDSGTGKTTVAGDVAVEAGQVFHSGVTDEFPPSGALKKVVAVEPSTTRCCPHCHKISHCKSLISQ